MIVDAHAHIFPRFRGRVAAGPVEDRGYGRIAIGSRIVQALPPCGERTEFTAEMLIAHMDWAGVDKAVLLQGPYYGECDQYVAKALARYPERLRGAAYFDPRDARAQEALAQACAESAFCAVKVEFSVEGGLCGLHPGARLDDPALTPFWDRLEQCGQVLVLDLGVVGSESYQTAGVRGIAEQHPELKIVIAHLAQPSPAAEQDPELWELWREQIDLGKLPNIWFDCAALPAFLREEDFPYPTGGRYLREAVERIGPQRIMWGTDAPGLLVHATYPQLLRFAELHLEFLSSHDRALVLGENALEVFGG